MSERHLMRQLPFDRVLVDRTRGQHKVLRRDYLAKGKLPIVDQGAQLVAGFTDDEASAYKGPLPVIVFGDHTRLFKYIDFPFALGADGVKVLEPAKWFEPRFLYYYLLTKDIPSRGYSRHFQFLRRLVFQWIPLSEQHRIVEILDQADHLRRLRAEADAKADRILPALLFHALGNPKDWAADPSSQPLEKLVQPVSGGTPSKRNRALWSGDIPWVSPKEMKSDFICDTQDHVSATALEETNISLVGPGSALIVVRGMILARDVPVALSLRRVTFNQDMKALLPRSNDVTGAYVWAALYLAKPLLQTLVRTAGHGTRKLDTPDLMEFPIPRPDSVRLARIASIVEHRRLVIERRQRAAEELDRLFAVLLSKAFEGSLTASWREKHIEELRQEMEHQTQALAEVTA